MSSTNGWSSVVALSEDLASYLRGYIYSKIVPASFTATYEGATIQIIFSAIRSQLTIDTTRPDTILVVAPFSGSIQTNTYRSIQGEVTLRTNLADLEVRPATAAAGNRAAAPISWTNAIYFLSPNVFSDLAVKLNKGSAEDADLLASFFNQAIQGFISQPFQLPEHTREMSELFVPTLVRFMTLVGGATGSELLMLTMMNGEQPPSGDQHNVFANSSIWSIPADSNAVIALSDYAALEYLAAEMETRQAFSDIDVSKSPAVLTAEVTKRSRSLDFKAAFSSKGLSASASSTGSGIFEIGASYLLTMAVESGQSGSQIIVLTSKLENSKVDFNEDNPIVIAIHSIQEALELFSPFHGYLFKQLIAKMKLRVENLIQRLLAAPEFETGKPIAPKFATITNLALNNGIVCTLELTEAPATTTASADALVAETEVNQAWSDLQDSISEALDKLAQLPSSELPLTAAG